MKMRRILICDDLKDVNHMAYAIPWENEATCFNIKFPSEILTTAEIKEMDEFDDVYSLFIFDSPEDLSFLKKMKNIKQLFIYDGCYVDDASLIDKCKNLEFLLIAGCKIKNLDDLFEANSSLDMVYVSNAKVNIKM